jgi:hypothetical protein
MSISSLSSTVTADPGLHPQARRYIQDLIGKTLDFFAENEDHNLNLVREHMLELLDDSSTHARTQNLWSACNLLHQQAEAFNLSLQGALHSLLEEEANIAVPEVLVSDGIAYRQVDPLDGISLSLIDMTEVERILLLDRVVLRFTDYYEASLNPLTLRLGMLLGLDAPSTSHNPFRPEVFVRAFLLAWENGKFDNDATLDLMSSLDPQHCVDLVPLYAELNQTLMHAGVGVPTLYRIRKSDEVGYSHPPEAPLSVGPKRRFGDGEVVLRDKVFFGNLTPTGPSLAAPARMFLQRLGVARHSGPDANRSSKRFAERPADQDAGLAFIAPADPEIVTYLGDLQASAGAALDYPILDGQDPGGRNVLRKMRDQSEVMQASDLDRGTVDAMVEVFDFVFSDQTVPLQMKFVLGRLQIPLLKAAMLDRDFFLSTDQPARRLVDTLARASVACDPEKGEQDPLFQRIENTIKRVLTEFEDDITLFGELLQEVTEFLFETEQQVQGHIAPVAEIETASELFEQALAHADKVVLARINALPPDMPLAPFLGPFLATQWREVLARAWLKVAVSPVQWEVALTTMDGLIWSTQPKTRTRERHQLVAVLPDLIRNLNTGLDAIEWTGMARATFTRRLIATHTLAIRMTRPVQATKSTTLKGDAGAKKLLPELERRSVGMLAGSDDRFDVLAQSLARGLWFDFKAGESDWQRRRLSWVSPMRTRLLFTDRDGFEPLVHSEREVATLLRHGDLIVVDPKPIVSRALERILSEDQVRQVA